MFESRIERHNRCTISSVTSIITLKRNTVGLCVTCRLTRPSHTCSADADDEDALIMRFPIQSQNPPQQEERPRSVLTFFSARVSDILHVDHIAWTRRDVHGRHGSQTYGISYTTNHIDSRKQPWLFFEGEIDTRDHSFTNTSFLSFILSVLSRQQWKYKTVLYIISYK